MSTRFQVLGLMILAAWLPAGPGWADGGIPDRRRNQFQNEPGYVAIPYVFEVPGLGSGYGFLGGMNNLRGTYTDIGGTIFEGDVSGGALGLESFHLLSKTLILDVGVAEGAWLRHINSLNFNALSKISHLISVLNALFHP